jgi:hypothetical protein
LEEIRRQLPNYCDLDIYTELNNRIDDKIELFKSEIKKYEDLIITNMDNNDGLQALLKEIPDKEYLIYVKHKIMSKVENIKNESDKKVLMKLTEFNNKIDSQRERLDKLHILKGLFDNYTITKNNRISTKDQF